MEAGSELQTPEPAFHTDDADEVAEYRTISALAVISLIFGLLSPLCFGSPIFFAIPLFGAALSVAALYRIEASEGALMGRWLARLGLALCVISLTASVTRTWATESLRTAQAEEFNENWIRLLLEGNTEEAFRFTLEANRSAPAGPPGPAPQAAEEPPYDQFLEDPVISLITTTGQKSEVEFVDTESYIPQPGGQFTIGQKFIIMPSAAGEDHVHPIELMITAQRSRLPREMQPRWLIREFVSPQAEAKEAHVH